MALIPEILERDATGETKRIYDDIKRLWGVPNVTTIVRHVASIEGCLEWYWATIEPAHLCGDFQETALALTDTIAAPPLPKLPLLGLRAMGVDASAERHIRDVYSAYDRNNRPNILFVCVLQKLLQSSVARSTSYETERKGWQPSPASPALVPMVQAVEMPADTLALAKAVGSWGFPVGTGFLPGVYRHLANWPAYFAYVGSMLWPRLEANEILHAGKSIADAATVAADKLVTKLPEPAAPLKPPAPGETALLLTLLENMTQKIPEMIVVCKLLGDALPDDGEEKPWRKL